MYRINFNGQQVSSTFKTYAEAKREIISISQFNGGGEMWIQKYMGDGEWFRSKNSRPHVTGER